MRGGYEVNPGSKSFGTCSANSLGLCDGLAGALKCFQGTCRPHSQTGTQGGLNAPLVSTGEKASIGKGQGRWDGRGGQWPSQLGRKALGDRVCLALVLSGGTTMQELGHLHHSSAPGLLPHFGSPLLRAAQSPGPCSHAAYMWVLLSTAMDTALHVCACGTPECQLQWSSALVRPNTNLGRVGPCTPNASPSGLNLCPH